MEYRISSTEEYATKINECKVWLATTGPMLDVSPRYFEVMLSKTLLLCNKMPKQYEDYLTDGVNCVMFENDLSDFDKKLDYYLNNESEMNKVIETAYNEAINNYTWHHMAKKLIKTLERIN
jgi:spore maturation protein CgeB